MVSTCLPVLTSHNRIRRSSPPDANCLPSGENATALALFRWPVSVSRAVPVATSQSRTLLSAPAEASKRPSELKATARTEPLWPASCRSGKSSARAGGGGMCSGTQPITAASHPRASAANRGRRDCSLSITGFKTKVQSSGLLWLAQYAVGELRAPVP